MLPILLCLLHSPEYEEASRGLYLCPKRTIHALRCSRGGTNAGTTAMDADSRPNLEREATCSASKQAIKVICTQLRQPYIPARWVGCSLAGAFIQTAHLGVRQGSTTCAHIGRPAKPRNRLGGWDVGYSLASWWLRPRLGVPVAGQHGPACRNAEWLSDTALQGF